MGHYDECREGYCPSCGAAPGNLKNGVCPFCDKADVTKQPEGRPDTRHLDEAVRILGGSGASRARRAVDYTIEVMTVSYTDFVVTANGRIVDSGSGTIEEATARATERADTLRRMGKTVKVVVHG